MLILFPCPCSVELCVDTGMEQSTGTSESRGVAQRLQALWACFQRVKVSCPKTKSEQKELQEVRCFPSPWYKLHCTQPQAMQLSPPSARTSCPFQLRGWPHCHVP